MNSKALFSFFMPGGFLCMAVAVLMHTSLPGPWLPTITLFYPLVVAAAGLLLGWRFNRSRLIFALLVLAMADRALNWLVQGALEPNTPGRLIFNLTAVLLPLNLLFFSLIQERGIINGNGLRRLLFILAQPLLTAFVFYDNWAVLNAWIEYPIIRHSLVSRYIVALHLPQIAVLVNLSVLLLICIRYATKRGAVENGFIWALVTCWPALIAGPGPVSTVYFTTAGLILVIAVIEASYVMAFRDELTGLPARRTLNEFLMTMGNRYAIAMLDIDFFKKFNDTYGHDVGDQVLRMVASKISGVNGGGKPFRYGGEEFTVVFPGKSRNEAVPYLEELRNVIQSSGFTIRSKKRPRKKPDKPDSRKQSQKRVAVTISIGVADRNGQQTTAQEVVKAADKALYRAKKAGRNRVSI